ncbi:hypothetical protein J4E82_009198 [Alternaria postmessia]|uniref:uncharacterized protein n=1 Tax=Alternaria postmessia TaxID=1187938 RepID=UPI0010DD0055|nr:uncharacterized protein J4E82_009198 [Alternaria postmessia]KAH6860401.1 hypothetical protein B0T12DRAFT_134074 [Alternaria alternata]KAI5372141.1 hypothetical protein J4E82_009198 [Alternaria postmessia]RYN68968.1 hypothetical protein AA0118_g816 [Alternaria tenuissima]
MVLRLFAPPGEGQHRLVPKRPDPIGANATLQYSVLSSTVVAAAYTSFASRYSQRVTPAQPLSRAAVFTRASARLGVWTGVAGAALNWYYYSAFAKVVVSQKVPEISNWKLYERTKSYTVDDGALAGAALGLAASVPSLIMRRPAIPRWTRCLGMMNTGACAGVLGAHAYFQYTGERQEAYKHLGRQLKRRSLEFWAIFWNAEMMASLDPIMQQYVRHNGFWYTRWLPEEVFDREVHASEPFAGSEAPAAITEAPVEDQPPFYIAPIEYAEDLRQIDVQSTKAKIEAMEADRQELLKEAEYLLFVNAQQQYEYCHLDTMDEEERHRRLQEIHVVDIAYNRLRAAAYDIDVKLIHWRMSLKHKLVWKIATTATSATPSVSTSTMTTRTDALADWLPAPQALTSFATHKPTYSMGEIEKLHWQIAAEVKRFEVGCRDERYPKEMRERWKRDAEDGSRILRAADHVLWRLMKAREGAGDGDTKNDGVVVGHEKSVAPVGQSAVTTEAAKLDTAATPARKELEKPRVDDKVTKTRTGALDADKS